MAIEIVLLAVGAAAALMVLAVFVLNCDDHLSAKDEDVRRFWHDS